MPDGNGFYTYSLISGPVKLAAPRRRDGKRIRGTMAAAFRTTVSRTFAAKVR